MEDRCFTPAEVCDLFGISKSTLLRWEREGLIIAPPRDLHQRQRCYTQKHMAEIGRPLLQKWYQQLAMAEHEPHARQRLESLAERVSLIKFVAFGDLSGLYEMAEREALSEETIKQLIHEALQYEPSDPIFRRIVEVIEAKVQGIRQGDWD